MTTTTHDFSATAKRLSGPALRTFFRIGEQWALSREEQMKLLGLTATSTYHKWKGDQDVRLGPDTIERISYVLGIFKALQILLSNPYLADGWIKKTNDAIPFGGHSPLAHMLQGGMQSLWEVRQYLDAQRGA